MRIFRSTTIDSNANTYVGSYGEITVADNLQMRIQDNTTPGGVSLSGDITFDGNVIGAVGNQIFVRADMVPTDPGFYQLGTDSNPWNSLYTLSITGAGNLDIFGGSSTWTFYDDGSTSFPAYTFPATDGTNGQTLVTDGAGQLTWGAGGGGNGNVSTGNYTFSGDYLLMPDAARLNSGGIGVTNSAEFGTVVGYSGPGVIDSSNIYMSAGTGEARIMVDANGAGLTYFGVENPGFAGMVSMDPNVTSMYAIEAAGDSNIIIGATQPGGTITTTNYRAGIGVLNDTGMVNGLYADTASVLLSAGSSGQAHNSMLLGGNQILARTNEGNAYTVTHQAKDYWETYSEDDITSPNVAYSWINSNLFDINDPTVFIENQGAASGTAYRWTFDAQGRTRPPVLTVTRGDVPSSTITGYTLLLGNGDQEAIISTPDGSIVGDINSQRLVINPGKGADGTSGEGGDIYLWAGRGGDTDGNGGDVKIRGGYGPGNGQGGYIRMEAGDAAGPGTAGYIFLQGGSSTASGGYLQLLGGYGGGGSGGYIQIEGGYGVPSGGEVTITGGTSGTSGNLSGNVTLASNGYQWQFGNGGELAMPAKDNQQQTVVGSTTRVAGLPYPGGYLNGVGDIWIASGEDVVGADLLVRAHGDPGGPAETVTEISRLTLVKDAWDLSAQPTMTVYGQVNSNATIALTTYDASTNGSNLLVITGNTIPHGSGRYFTYAVTEFKRTVD